MIDITKENCDAEIREEKALPVVVSPELNDELLIVVEPPPNLVILAIIYHPLRLL